MFLLLYTSITKINIGDEDPLEDMFFCGYSTVQYLESEDYFKKGQGDMLVLVACCCQGSH